MTDGFGFGFAVEVVWDDVVLVDPVFAVVGGADLGLVDAGDLAPVFAAVVWLADVPETGFLTGGLFAVVDVPGFLGVDFGVGLGVAAAIELPATDLFAALVGWVKAGNSARPRSENSTKNLIKPASLFPK